MSRKKLGESITLFAKIPKEHDDLLREIAYKEKISKAAVVREILEDYFEKKNKQNKDNIDEGQLLKYVKKELLEKNLAQKYAAQPVVKIFSGQFKIIILYGVKIPEAEKFSELEYKGHNIKVEWGI